MGVFYKYYLTLVLGMMSVFVFGQDTNRVKIPSLEELANTKVFSASRSKQTLSEAPANILVIAKEQILSRGYRTLEEVMKDLPGFDFAVGEPSGEYPAHFLFRGVGDVGQTKFVIMIDGIPQNDISNGWTRGIGYNFVMSDVERIEFVSGPGSALYGRNSFAGFINVITKDEIDSDKKTSVDVKLNGGTYNTYNPELYFKYKGNNGLKFQLSGRYYYSKGDQGLHRYDPGKYFHGNYEPDSVMTINQGVIANDSIKPLADGFKTGINDYYIRGKLAQGGFSLSINFWDKKEGLGSEVVGYEYFTNTAGIDYGIRHQGKSVGMNYDYQFSEDFRSISRLYYVNTSVLPETGFTYTYQYQSVDNGIDSATQDRKKSYKSEGFLFGVEQQFIFDFGEKNRFVTSVQAEQKVREYFNISVDEQQDRNSNISSKPGEEPVFLPVYYSKNGAILVQDEHQITDKIKATAGARYDFDQFFGNVFNPRMALVYNQEEGFGAKFFYSHGFKAPTIFELHDEWRGNSSLTPERIQTSELEISYKKKNRFYGKVNLFHNHLKNLILVQSNPDTSIIPIGANGEHTNVYQNIGDKRIMGASINMNFNILENLQGFANYNFTADRDFKPIDNIAMHKLNIGLTYLAADMIYIDLRTNIIGKIKAPLTNRYFYEKTPETIAAVGYDYVTEDNPDGFLNGVAIFNLNIRTKDLISSDRFSLSPSLLVKNLFNTSYAFMGRQSGDGLRPVDALQPYVRNPVGFIPAYHPQPGIEVFIGLNFGF